MPKMLAKKADKHFFDAVALDVGALILQAGRMKMSASNSKGSLI